MATTAALREALDRGARGIVLDLRANPGGYVNEPVEVASQFLSSGVVYLSQARSGTRTPHEVKPGGIAIVQGAGPVRAYNRFRQTNEFYYLTGIEIPSAYAVLRESDRSCTLYLAPQPEDKPLEDRQFGPQDAEMLTGATGIDAVMAHSELPKALARVTAVYLLMAPSETELSARDVLEYCDRLGANEPLGSILSRDRQFICQVVSRCSGAEIVNLTPLIDVMRTVKSPAEIRLLRRAGKLSAEAVLEAMKATKQTRFENELEAIAFNVFAGGGARGLGYKPIIPCGRRIYEAHYIDNDQPLEDGEMILMDCAPDVNYYTSDIGRMWPVNGRYSAGSSGRYPALIDSLLSR
jgi:Xaa-Pro aminopeptidase